MRELEDCCGPWHGFYIQWNLRGHMRLTLNFRGGKVDGGGTDQIGGFTIAGTYGTEGEVEFRKKYSTHTIFYRGKWDGSMIFGTWQLGKRVVFDHGEFEIWPENEELGLESVEQVEELAATA